MYNLKKGPVSKPIPGLEFGHFTYHEAAIKAELAVIADFSCFVLESFTSKKSE
jgi:hypothetical protein